MYRRDTLGLEEARTAVDAVLAEAGKEPNRPIAVAVVDDRGDLIYGARMDGAYPLYVHMAMNKAYTAARMLRDTLALQKLQQELNRELGTWTDSRLTDIQGGGCIIKPGNGYIPLGPGGTVVGGIGVSGRPADEDEQLAQVGLKALRL